MNVRGYRYRLTSLPESIVKRVSRRAFVGRALKAAAAGPFILRHSYRVFAETSNDYPERVVRLMRESLAIDMLNQFLYRADQRELREKWLTEPGAFTEANFQWFKSTGVSAINFGEGAGDADQAKALFTKWNTFLGWYPQWLMRIEKPADLTQAKEQGKFGIIFGLQSSSQFQTVDDLDLCYAFGLRVSQLSYNFRSLVADGAFEPYDGGVSEYGGRVIDRMNRVGVAVDLGHASDKTKLDALTISRKPVILSHGNCRALNPDALRATADDAIRKLAAKGGVMGISDIAFTVKGTEPVSIDDVVDHYDHVRDLVGIEHVGVGSDAGIESNDLGSPSVLAQVLAEADRRYNVHGNREIVKGLEGPNRMYELAAALVRRGYTDEHIRLVLGGNWARVLNEIWKA